MKRELNFIMLIDDDLAANYFHKIIIEDAKIGEKLKVFPSGQEALDYLASAKERNYPLPDLILLDINMPRIDGWQFMGEFRKLGIWENSPTRIVMLTTSSNPRDKERADKIEEIVDLINKPLSVEKLQMLKEKFYT